MSREKIGKIKDALNNAIDYLESIDFEITTRNSSLRDLEIELRSARNDYFPLGYFSDAAWDILLDLDRSDSNGYNSSVTDVGTEAKIPLATTLRYLSKLEKDGFIVRIPDENDHRRSIIKLSKLGRDALDQTFSRVDGKFGRIDEGAFLLAQ
jgi:DNA-binding MarR family transcriptional regulator